MESFCANTEEVNRDKKKTIFKAVNFEVANKTCYKIAILIWSGLESILDIKYRLEVSGVQKFQAAVLNSRAVSIAQLVDFQVFDFKIVV